MRILVAGSPPPSALIARLQATLGWEFIQVYGLTETSPILTVSRLGAYERDLPEAERVRLLARAGIEVVGVDVRVRDDRGHDVATDDATVGEVVARGNVIMEGYWRQSEETAEVLRDGWFRTGDLATWDACRSLNLVDRKKDLIISGGENISSIEIEDVLYTHSAVLEACVIGVPCDKWGETVKALIVLREGCTIGEAEMIGYCRERLAHFKCPTSVDCVDSLPRTATGKLQKFKIREPYWAGREKRIQ